MVDAGIDVHPVRSILFVPANREDRMRKSLTLDTDAVIFDLESAIPRGEATVARSMVRAVLDSHHAARPRICVRISAVTTDEFADDLTAAVHPSLAAVVLPQVVSSDDVVTTDAALGTRRGRCGRPRRQHDHRPLARNGERTAHRLRNRDRVRPASPTWVAPRRVVAISLVRWAFVSPPKAKKRSICDRRR